MSVHPSAGSAVVPDAGLHNTRVTGVSPLISPALLREDLPLDAAAAKTVGGGRADTVSVLDGDDDRVLVVVGPCSVHDTDAALQYARLLADKADELRDDLHIIMRVYFEKPRTTLGWKGLINDPNLDGSFAVNNGLRMARRLLLDILALGMPVGCEFLDPITPQFIADAVSWGSIGARTASSQVHRQLCSGLSMPIGIKNATDGDVSAAVHAVAAASAPHVFPGVNDDGLAALLTTSGNPDCHVILRGGSGGPNYDAGSVSAALSTLDASGLPERLLVDCSHGNSGKDHVRQAAVVDDITGRIAAGERGVAGLMMESFLEAGNQKLVLGSAGDLVYGQSITDKCMDWDTTAAHLDALASAVRDRRR